MSRSAAQPSSDPPVHGFDPGAGLLAFLLPGLGYVVRGEMKRGILLASGVLSMTLLGIFIGGLDVVDRVEDRWWFLPQAGLGPLAFLLDHLHRNVFPNEATPSIGRVNEIGTLLVVLGGMCNLISVIDCLIPTIKDDDGGLP